MYINLDSVVICVRNCSNTDKHCIPLVYGLQLHPSLKAMRRPLRGKRISGKLRQIGQ